MKKILLSFICLSYILQAHEEQQDIITDIEMQDLTEHKSSLTTKYNSSNSSVNINSNNVSTQLSASSMPINPGQSFRPSEGITPAGLIAVGVTLTSEKHVAAVNSAADLGGVAGSPAAEMAALNFAPTVGLENSTPSSPTGPANRNLSDASSNSALNVTAPSLNGATFQFTAFTGTATGGNFSLDLVTLSNTTVTQDSANTAIGSLTYVYPSVSASYSAVSLTGATIDSATVTGASADDYFTGTHVTAGTISSGNFDIVFIEYPIGTVFNIVNGDLGPTGTFTTTSAGYGYLTGTNNITSITNGEVTLIGSVQGTFNYLGTDVPGATLQGATIFFTGVNAAGTATDANHFNASSFAGTIGNAETSLSITYSFTNPASAAGLNISNGSFAGETLSIPSITETITTSSEAINSATEYTAELNIMNPFSCIDGTASLAGAVSITENPIIILNATVQGAMQGSTNGIIFNSTNITAGDIDGTNINAGSCP